MKKPLFLEEQIQQAQDKVIKCKERLEKYQRPYEEALDPILRQMTVQTLNKEKDQK